MLPIDIYRSHGSRSQGFFNQAIRSGAVVGLDAAGFRAGFFDDKQTKELLSFVVLTGEGGAIPATPDEFSRLPFVEAEVGEHNATEANVTIRSVSDLGEWARTAWLTSKAGFPTVPEAHRLPADVLTSLMEELRRQEMVLWVNPQPPSAGSDGLLGACLIKCDFDRRAVVLGSGSWPSYLVRL